MSVLSGAHVHTTYCDGKTPAADMAKRAWELGFVSLGFFPTRRRPLTPDTASIRRGKTNIRLKSMLYIRNMRTV